MKLLARRFGVVAPIALVVAAGWILLREIRGLPLGDVVQYLGEVSPGWLLLAVGATVVGYAALVGYDVLALRHVGHPPALSNGGAYVADRVRDQQRSVRSGSPAARCGIGVTGWVGPSGRQITDVVVFVSLGFWLGYVVLTGLLFPVAPPAIPPQLRLGVPLPFLGWACVALLIAYLVCCA